MMEKEILKDLYLLKGKSMQEIAKILKCSVHKVSYWLLKYDIYSRSISEAIYLKNNPNGDPFKFIIPKTLNEAMLFGLGVGLYWGEGNKANKNSVRLGNTDPALIRKFMDFLIKIFDVKKKDFRFGLQIFTDIDSGAALDFWVKSLKIRYSQFYKPTVTKSSSLGTYRQKSQYGVLTVHYHNTKLRNLLIKKLADVAQR